MKSDYIELTVRGFHLDVFQHVNNARYLEFLEDARWATFDHVLAALRKRHWSLVIANININYRKPAVIGQRLRIDAKLGEIRNTSFTIAQKVTAAEDPHFIFADAVVTCVFLDTQNRPVKIDETVRHELHL